MNKENTQCSNCVYFNKYTDADTGRCLRYPPIPIGVSSGNFMYTDTYPKSFFPTVRPIDWCGEHKRNT